jgi:MFS transporter, putative metabolite:H+ symporter
LDIQYSERRNVVAIVLVAALGYFVDIYDLILFSIVRISSLKALGSSGDSLLSDGVLLLNMQMAGMLVGGILWGILGDKKGRISVLFGSIILYSLANFANGFVQNISQYAVLRLIAGIGLAGELGAGITLVSEVMSKESRGYGTMIVATIGILGAVAAALIGDFFEWRIAFFVGGGLGLILLILRIGIYESGMFSAMLNKDVKKGSFLKLFTNWNRFVKYIKCIAIGVPIWFVVGILITFSPEFAKVLGVKEPISAGSAVMYCYIGLALGDFTSGSLSQLIRSRKRVVFIYIIIMTFFIGVYLFYNHFNSFYFYTLCIFLGFGSGYWAIFVTIASEQFGTNLRATVTTTVPNFVRGGVVPLTLAFEFISRQMGIIYGGLIIGIAALIIAYISAINLEETYGKDLNYVELL